MCVWRCSPREINKGDEVAWYADGDNMVRNKYNPSIAYVFGKCSSAYLSPILQCVMAGVVMIDEKGWSSVKGKVITLFGIFFWNEDKIV